MDWLTVIAGAVFDALRRGLIAVWRRQPLRAWAARRELRRLPSDEQWFALRAARSGAVEVVNRESQDAHDVKVEFDDPARTAWWADAGSRLAVDIPAGEIRLMKPRGFSIMDGLTLTWTTAEGRSCRQEMRLPDGLYL